MAIEQPDTPADVNLPLDTKFCDVLAYVATNHADFCNSYGAKTEEIITSTYAKPPDAVTVATGPSYSSTDKTRLTISKDEPLICFSGQDIASSIDTVQTKTNRILLEINGKIEISFQPTIRVLDNGIATSLGLVNEFVAIPYWSGYSVEHRVARMETAEGL
ncbi:hypothetical protein Q9L58_009255 [Maublancomyces gigas]|uniref:Uncharacterized protein n=1 Tax=Discina gigas TaxID=1032678 RepID=A0ABR3G7W3_9PEZI